MEIRGAWGIEPRVKRSPASPFRASLSPVTRYPPAPAAWGLGPQRTERRTLHREGQLPCLSFAMRFCGARPDVRTHSAVFFQGWACASARAQPPPKGPIRTHVGVRKPPVDERPRYRGRRPDRTRQAAARPCAVVPRLFFEPRHARQRVPGLLPSVRKPLPPAQKQTSA